VDIRRTVPLMQLLVIALAISASPSAAQTPETQTEETVADLAAGRVVILVAKGAILVGTVENPIEADTSPPTPVELSSVRLGVILGPARWSSPSTRHDIARLNQELPHLRSNTSLPTPHLQQAEPGTEATDIEAIGQGLLERLSQVAQNLHGKVDLPSGDPLAQLIVVDYLAGYGPEVWELGYGMKQQEEEADYWTTRILRPSYLQFWPPEKGQPRTLVEFAYPPENPPAPLLDLLRQKDPRIERMVTSDAKMAEVASQLLQGDSNKVLPADATQFLRAALAAISPPDARQTMAIIGEETGFAWILAPPPEPKEASPQINRPPDAPSLMAPH